MVMLVAGERTDGSGEQYCRGRQRHIVFPSIKVQRKPHSRAKSLATHLKSPERSRKAIRAFRLNYRAADSDAPRRVDSHRSAELIAMMTPFSCPMSDRPLVPPITHPDIGYGVTRPSRDPVANLIRDVQEGKVEVKFEETTGN